MSAPDPNVYCPPDYSCQFTRLSPRVINHTHNIGPWWHGFWGVFAVVIAIAAIAAVLCTAIYYFYELRKDARERKQRELEQRTRIAIEEQRTMQIDAAKGNPEMLKIIESMKGA